MKRFLVALTGGGVAVAGLLRAATSFERLISGDLPDLPEWAFLLAAFHGLLGLAGAAAGAGVLFGKRWAWWGALVYVVLVQALYLVVALNTGLLTLYAAYRAAYLLLLIGLCVRDACGVWSRERTPSAGMA